MATAIKLDKSKARNTRAIAHQRIDEQHLEENNTRDEAARRQIYRIPDN